MPKLLLLIVIIWLVYVLLKKYATSLKGLSSEPSQAEDMVCCSHCGVHLPRSESIMSQTKFYCCEEHRQLGRPEKP